MHALNGGRVYSTGQVARICQCAPRTVSKWCDAGLLVAYRLPLRPGKKRQDEGDRRITRASLTAFLQSRGMPLPSELGGLPCLLLVGCSFPAWMPLLPGVEVHEAADAFEAGRQAARTPPAAAVVDLSSVGRGNGLMIAAGLLAGKPRPVLAAIASEDEFDPPALGAAGFAITFRRPFRADALTQWVTRQLAI